MEEVTRYNLANSNITIITDDVMNSMLKKSEYLWISNNKLTTLPRSITKADNKTELWISNNPYECNCDMMWMRDWLVRATNAFDKGNGTCGTGKMKGTFIANLLPSVFPQ